MKLLIAIAVVLLETALSPRVYDQDVMHVSPTDRSPRMGYHWWKNASGEERLTAIAVAIQGLRDGWTYGELAKFNAMVDNLNEGYLKHKFPYDAVTIATRPRPVTPPVFTKPLAVYRAKVDDAYARVPSIREQDVALVLLCFADSKIIACHDKQGKLLR